MTDLLNVRKDPEAARALLTKLLPVKTHREAVLGVLAEATILAHALAPTKWGVSLLRDLVRLNLGRIEVLTVARETLHLVLYRPKVPSELLGLIVNEGYESVKDSCFIDVHYSSADVWEPVKGAWRELARRAAETPKHSMTQKAHSPGVLDLLRQEGWPDVPNPLSAA